ncbi:MAG: hypothetical protein KGJ62_06380 [Armatimonadetes bacterium]|nr:hypothetical protein [Armatimonadota bacterium]MDE2206541.1 hypothetical protein [Armatimonadota bacterium]
MPRRDFVKLGGAAVSMAALKMPVMAGPFEAADFAALIPPEKKLHPDWVRALYARGEPTTYRLSRNELRYIGMPVGGLCCGTVYLGGDGRLWNWDVFNANPFGVIPGTAKWPGYNPRPGHMETVDAGSGAAYVAPHLEQSPFDQGFAIEVDGHLRRFEAGDWREITFQGQYPTGKVEYSAPDCPVTVKLNAWTPFIPLNTADSSLPVTVMEFAVTNHSAVATTVRVGGWLQNACSRYSARAGSGQRVNQARTIANRPALECRFELPPPPEGVNARRDVTIDDFQHEGYGRWHVEGAAFGSGPILRTSVPAYQGNLGGIGARVVNSHASAPGSTVEQRDSATGMLTSPPFTIERNFITFYIGGGSDANHEGIRLLVDGKTVRQASGHDSNEMQLAQFDVTEFAGQEAVIQVYDTGTGGWGNVGVDDIVQTDRPAPPLQLPARHDWGTMTLVGLSGGTATADADPAALFAHEAADTTSRQADAPGPVGAVTSELRIPPGATRTASFAVTWHFKNTRLPVTDAETGNWYAARFADSGAAAAYVAREYRRLRRDTMSWNRTWYNSTLPWWFLERTFSNTCTLATSTAHRFGSGRFWAWEGVGCCQGTCCHVWHYAQAMGRIFPELERITRERVDFGVAFDTRTGMIGYRGEGTGQAVDGQAGRILGALREHQMSADSGFLTRIWPHVKLAIEYLEKRTCTDGLLCGAQDNTLDAAWFGKIAWISSLYLAALHAGEAMADDMQDREFAAQCRQRIDQVRNSLESELFNGRYFIQLPDPEHPGALGTYKTCHIDQVHGQSWAWQVALGRILNREKTVSALRSLWRYNFAPDVGPFRRKYTAGRPYALAGDAGLIMATNPQDTPNAFGDPNAWQFGYFNECMSGFEHQAASHMIAEGMLTEGLAVTRAIHDRYHAARRNPFNEVECSDHYSRAMASYGSFITACGFEYSGPRRHIGFDPRMPGADFRAPFTAAEGWGTYSQRRTSRSLLATLDVKYGRLRLATVRLPGDWDHAEVHIGGTLVAATSATAEGRTLVTLREVVTADTGRRLTIRLWS